MQRIFATLVFLLTASGGFPLHADEVDPKYPLRADRCLVTDGTDHDIAHPVVGTQSLRHTGFVRKK